MIFNKRTAQMALIGWCIGLSPGPEYISLIINSILLFVGLVLCPFFEK
jgi:hypothetical protein